MSVKRRKKIGYLLLVNVLILNSVSVAEELDGTPAVERITVTAQKREQLAIEVPMSVTTISGTDIERKGIHNLQDLSFSVPGMTMREDGPGSYTVFMRGLSNVSGDGALVGLYLDQVPLTISGYDQLDVRPIDFQRIEILKGPQGTLYGSGSIAGTIRYIANNPDLGIFEGSIGTTLAKVDQGDTKKTITGIVNIPVIEDVFALRIAGELERDGGWIDQPEAGIEDGNGQDLNHFRLKALWWLSENLSAEGLYINHKNTVELGLGYEEFDRTVSIAIDPAIKLLPKEMDYELYGLTLNYSNDLFDVVGVTSYVDYDHQYPTTYFGTDQTIYAGILEGKGVRFQTAEQFTQEIRFSSIEDGRDLHWSVGAYYRDVENQTIAMYDTLYDGIIYPDSEYSHTKTSKSAAVFSDVSYQLSEKLELGVGVRKFIDKQKVLHNIAKTMKEKDFDALTYRVYASYALTESSHIYTNIGKGFRSGGFNEIGRSDYGPEDAINYEIGSKGVYFDGLLSLEAALYYTEYNNMIRRALVLDEATNTLESMLSNVGKVEVKGVEFGSTINATKNLSFTATAALVDSEVVEINSTDAINIVGDKVDYVPKLSYTLGANYNFSIVGYPSYARVDYSYRDKVSYIDRDSFPVETVTNQFSDKLSLLDARIGLAVDSLSFELFGSNLTNQNKYIDPYSGWKNANRTRPRMIGVKVDYTF